MDNELNKLTSKGLDDFKENWGDNIFGSFLNTKIHTINIKNESNNLTPIYVKEGDSGFDLRAWIKVNENNTVHINNNPPYIELKSLERRLIHTGLYMELPYGTELQVRTRSGCALKQGLIVLNSPGTVN